MPRTRNQPAALGQDQDRSSAPRTLRRAAMRLATYFAPHPPFHARLGRLDARRGRTAYPRLRQQLLLSDPRPCVPSVSKRYAVLSTGTAFGIPTCTRSSLPTRSVRSPRLEQVRFVNSAQKGDVRGQRGARITAGTPSPSSKVPITAPTTRRDQSGFHAANVGNEAPASVAYARGSLHRSWMTRLSFLSMTRRAAGCCSRTWKALAAVLLDPFPSRIGMVPAASICSMS